MAGTRECKVPARPGAIDLCQELGREVPWLWSWYSRALGALWPRAQQKIKSFVAPGEQRQDRPV